MNWNPITIDDLKAAGHGDMITAAQTTAVGSVDPVATAIAGAVARVRGAIQTGNQLDIDPARVPNSLRELTLRTAIFALVERIQIPLNVDQRETKKNDCSYLNRITDQKLRFERPDNAGGSAEMQLGSTTETVRRGNHGNSREDLRRL
jgi:hypothetical protein